MSDNLLSKYLNKVKKTRFQVVGIGFSKSESDILLYELKKAYKDNKEMIKSRINQ